MIALLFIFVLLAYSNLLANQLSKELESTEKLRKVLRSYTYCRHVGAACAADCGREAKDALINQEVAK